ncbi:hypothetical protein EOM09_08440 [bacterium]|nr:hypothetical protein [bacterium]
MRRIYTSLDLGSNSLKIVVAEIFNQKFSVLAVAETKCKGVKKGLIVNAEETIYSLKEILNEVETKLNTKVTKIIVSVPLYNVEFIKGVQEKGYEPFVKNMYKEERDKIFEILFLFRAKTAKAAN